MKRIFKYPVILAFWSFLCIFAAIDILTPEKAYSEIENRQLATMPKFSVNSFLNNSFSRQFETYLGDQFAFRDRWITLKSVSESVLLKTENNGIAYGADGYMFEKNRESLTIYFARNADRITQFFENNPDRNITLAIVPGAEIILGGKVPAGMVVYDQMSAIETLYDRVEKAGGRTLDLYTPLEACEGDYIFYRTDHHWTNEGALIGARAFLESVGRSSPDMSGTEPRQVGGFLGTHYNKAKSWNVRPDTITYYDMPFYEIQVSEEVKPAYYDPAMFELRDKYAAFMWGNAGLTTLRRTAEPADRLLIIKDSYANTMAPILSRSYDEVVLIDLRSVTFNLSDYLAEESFDDILIIYSFRSVGSDNNIAKLNY